MGFADGIKNNIYRAEEAATSMANAAKAAVENALDINSPSKVFYKIGSFSGEGFVGALEDYGDKASGAGESIAEKAKTGLSSAVSKIKDYISGNIETQPTIRPVLDLSELEGGTKSIDSLFSRKSALSINADISNDNKQKTQSEANGENTGGTSLIFTQNISSPKALDAITIYRQTKNQFSRMKEALGRV